MADRFGDTDVDKALQRLGLDYTGFRETEPCNLEAGPALGEGMEKFAQALVDGEWDMVIVDHVCGLLEIPPRAAEAMTTHVTEGGSLILHSWQTKAEWGHVFADLWEAMGFQLVGDFGGCRCLGVAFPAFWWESDHPVFTAPLDVPEYPLVGASGRSTGRCPGVGRPHVDGATRPRVTRAGQRRPHAVPFLLYDLGLHQQH